MSGLRACRSELLLPRSTPTLRSLSADSGPRRRPMSFFSALKKTHVATWCFCEHLGILTPYWKESMNPVYTVWRRPIREFNKLWMECISLTRAVQTEALRGIGIYRWQEGGKKGSIRFMVQPTFFRLRFHTKQEEWEVYFFRRDKPC